MNDEEARVRTKVLNYALTLESMSSIYLGLLLDINPSNSKTLGNTGSSLSMNDKINILTDMNSMNADDAKRFQLFMKIRNQFMHNRDATSFEKCLAFLNGTKKNLLKLYPQKEDIAEEKKIELAFDNLLKDLINVLLAILNVYQEKIKAEVERDFFKRKFEEYRRELGELVDYIVYPKPTNDNDHLIPILPS